MRYRDLGRRLLPDRSFELFETVFVVLGRARPALSFFTVDGNAAGLTRHALKSMDPTRKFARLEFNGVAARPLGTPGGESAPFARTLPQSVCAADHLIGEADGGLDTGRAETRPASHASVGLAQHLINEIHPGKDGEEPTSTRSP